VARSEKRGPRKPRHTEDAKQGLDEIHPTPEQARMKKARMIIKPTHDEVLAAVRSLYADELKPFGRILRKRVAERASVDACTTILRNDEEHLPDVDIGFLKLVCEENKTIRIESEQGGDWSARVDDAPECFVDIYSHCDSYPSEMWHAIASYFEDEGVCLPGSRYDCAQLLKKRRLPFFHGCSLGHICHIVQLAISQRKILGYLDGSMVPYAKSQSAFKDKCAMSAEPCMSLKKADSAIMQMSSTGLPKATWERARECLEDILCSSPEGPQGVHMVPLSNVKRLFKSKYKIELSETMLGHSKLTELLQDERFADICTVQLQKFGYVVLQVQKAESNAGVPPADEDPELRRVEVNGKRPSTSFGTDDLLPSWSPQVARMGSLVQRTFIHASLPPPTPLACTRPRSQSLPRNAWSAYQSLLSNNMDQVKDHTDAVERSCASDGSDEGLFAVSAIRTRDQSFQDGRGIPEKMDADKQTLADCGDFSLLGDAFPDFADDSQCRKGLKFCLDEPLAFEEASCNMFGSGFAQFHGLPTESVDDCGPTPSVYEGDHGRNVHDSESFLAQFPASPSPTYCRTYDFAPLFAIAASFQEHFTTGKVPLNSHHMFWNPLYSSACSWSPAHHSCQRTSLDFHGMGLHLADVRMPFQHQAIDCPVILPIRP
jgi:hypothetical protein